MPAGFCFHIHRQDWDENERESNRMVVVVLVGSAVVFLAIGLLLGSRWLLRLHREISQVIFRGFHNSSDSPTEELGFLDEQGLEETSTLD
jgi:hypothetical protein